MIWKLSTFTDGRFPRSTAQDAHGGWYYITHQTRAVRHSTARHILRYVPPAILGTIFQMPDHKLGAFETEEEAKTTARIHAGTIHVGWFIAVRNLFRYVSQARSDQR